ncbi:MAG TPA: RNA polymerase sigma factor [Candidatus Dormibacteraeota bacterium]|nr:RNA polymerase sigma factor [Candidatus Dormibacteraeota bacterium]
MDLDENAADLQCVAAYREGDPRALDPVYSRYSRRVRSVCARHLGDGHLAEDVVQDCFHKLLRSLDSVRTEPEFNVSAWIHRIAVNLCLDELRRRARASRLGITPSSEAVEEAARRVPDADRGRDPAAALEVACLRALLWDAAARLPDRQRTVLALREVQGLSYTRIARVMGISDSAVETLLHRARRRFREAYREAEAEVWQPAAAR